MWVRAFLSAILCVLFSGGARAQSFESTPTRAVLFKNGLGWITEEGRGKGEGEWMTTTLHGHPLLGTLAVASRTAGSLLEVKAIPPRVFQPLGNLPQATRTISGQVEVTASGRTITGRLAGVTTLVGTEPLLVVDANQGTQLLPFSKVERVTAARKPEELGLASAEAIPSLQVRVGKKEEVFHLVSTYLSRGIGWMPTYRLVLNEGGKGTLSLTAEVVNDALDLASVEVHFATGEGVFLFSRTDSPLFSDTVQPATVMDAVVEGLNLNVNKWVSNNPASYDVTQTQEVTRPTQEQGVVPPGEETYLYGPVQLSLKKGERVLVPLATASVPAGLIYYWKVPLHVDQPPENNNVLLSVMLVNETPFPLTTGPLLVLHQGHPVGQGIITYTHAGEEALIPIAVGSTLTGIVSEWEVDRAKSTATFRGTRYDKVTMKGALKLKNTKKENIKARIEKPVLGKVISVSRSGKSTEQFLSPYDPNPKSNIVWSLELKGGETAQLEYCYDLLVQRYERSGYRQ